MIVLLPAESGYFCHIPLRLGFKPSIVSRGFALDYFLKPNVVYLHFVGNIFLTRRVPIFLLLLVPGKLVFLLPAESHFIYHIPLAIDFTYYAKSNYWS